MVKEKLERNDVSVNRGMMGLADCAIDSAAITKHAVLNDGVDSLSVAGIDKVLGIVFLNKCDMVREFNNPLLMPAEDVLSISGYGFVVSGRIERGIVGITETGDAMRAGVEVFQKLLGEGQAGDNVGLLLRIKKEYKLILQAFRRLLRVWECPCLSIMQPSMLS